MEYLNPRTEGTILDYYDDKNDQYKSYTPCGSIKKKFTNQFNLAVGTRQEKVLRQMELSDVFEDEPILCIVHTVCDRCHQSKGDFCCNTCGQHDFTNLFMRNSI
uniref:Uncharacterized protein n=1 Tax=Romanomermis culicivorax TaxID=13658 RepID=A0A915KFV3_ROMCU